MHFITNLLTGAVGIPFRRWWGGWEAPNHFVKLILGFVLAFIACFLVTENWHAASAFSICIGMAFLNPFHSYGQGMGLDQPGKSTLKCILVMGGSYSMYTVPAGLLVAYLTHDPIYLLYCLHGAAIPFIYLASWLFWIHVLGKRSYNVLDPVTGNVVASVTDWRRFGHTGKKQVNGKWVEEWFCDGPQAVGECGIGFWLLGGP